MQTGLCGPLFTDLHGGYISTVFQKRAGHSASWKKTQKRTLLTRWHFYSNLPTWLWHAALWITPVCNSAESIHKYHTAHPSRHDFCVPGPGLFPFCNAPYCQSNLFLCVWAWLGREPRRSPSQISHAFLSMTGWKLTLIHLHHKLPQLFILRLASSLLFRSQSVYPPTLEKWDHGVVFFKWAIVLDVAKLLWFTGHDELEPFWVSKIEKCGQGVVPTWRGGASGHREAMWSGSALPDFLLSQDESDMSLCQLPQSQDAIFPLPVDATVQAALLGSYLTRLCLS